MDNEEKFELITRGVQEVIGPEDLKTFIDTGEELKHYIGFEISGKIHLGTGLQTGKKIADFQKAGVKCSCYLATYHAWINNKLGGNLDTIRHFSDYFKEGLKKSIEIMGGDPAKVKFVSGDELYHNNDEYWRTVIDIAKNMTLNRSLRAITIMGRKEGENVSTAQLFYPAMQVADIFSQGLNIAHAGMDQRKAHVVAREVALKLVTTPLHTKNGALAKPVAIHHPLLMGLNKPPVNTEGKDMQEILSEMKMSKSVAGSAVFVTDSTEEIKEKMKNAYCPAQQVELNPVMNWAEHVLFTSPQSILHIERPTKFGGSVDYTSYEKLRTEYTQGKLHPMDLKNAVGERLTQLLEPVRKHFAKGKLSKFKEELDVAQITR